MNSEPRDVIKIFGEALALNLPAERTFYLDQACAGDAALRQEVESLLSAHSRTGDFLGQTGHLSAPDLLLERTGTMIGRYKLLQKIGEGGFGVVYLAEQEEPVQRQVALKIIKPGMDSREVVARFEAERQALALMDHPSIARVLDGGVTGAGRPYFVMELVHGTSVTRYCDDKALSPAERLDIFIQVCHAVQHAHQKGIIHRDLKPNNVLVTLYDGKPVPKIIDFGVAKALGQKLTDKTLFTAFQHLIGTPAYMSPEQAELGGLDVDTRSDIYSLGVLLYELLIGVTPFDAETLAKAALDEIRRTIREQEPLKPSTRLQSLGDRLPEVAKRRRTQPIALTRLLQGDLDWIVLKCLEKDRGRRYETAGSLGVDLRRFLTHQTVSARPPSLNYRLRKFIRRNRLVVAAAGAVTVALVLGGLVSASQALRAYHHALDAQQAVAELERNLYAADIYLAQNAIKEGNFGLAKRALSSHLPRRSAPDARGFEWCYFWGLCEGQKLASWHAHSNQVIAVDVAREGHWVASAGWDRRANVWDSRNHTLLASFPDADCVAFSTDAAWLFTASVRGRVSMIRSGTWKVVETVATGDVSPGTARHVAHLAVSPTASVLAVCTGGSLFSGNGSIQLFGFQKVSSQTETLPDSASTLGNSNRLHLIGQLKDSGDRMRFSADGQWLVTGCVNGKIVIWDVATQKPVKSVGPVGGLASLALSPDRRLLATTEFWSSKIRLWDLINDRELPQLSGHSAMVWSVAFSPDGKTLASASSDQTIRLWDVSSRQQTALFLGHESEIWALMFSPHGEFLYSGSKDETVAVWPSQAIKERNTVPSVEPRPAGPLFSPDGRIIATQCSQGGIKLIEAPTAAVTSTKTSEKVALWFTPDSRTLLTLGTNDALHFWDIPAMTLRQTRELTPKPAPPIYHAVASGDGRLLASVWRRGSSIQLWDIASTSLKLNVSSRADRFEALIFSKDGRWLAAVGAGKLDLWDLSNPEARLEFVKHKDGVSMAAFSPDGDTFASSSIDNTVKLWSLSRRCELATLRGHREGVMGVSFSPDGRTLASASADRSFKFWNVATRREVAFFGGPSAVDWAGFSPDARCFGYICSFGKLTLLRCPAVAEIDRKLNLPPGSGR